MKRLFAKITIISLILMLVSSGLLLAEEPVRTETPTFVDIDGDGIDDNARDANEDGIPDKFAPGYIAPNPAMADMTLEIPGMGSENTASMNLIAMNHLQHFAQLSFFARGLDRCRSNLESQFSGGIGVGITAGGGPCAGGVCF